MLPDFLSGPCFGDVTPDPTPPRDRHSSFDVAAIDQSSENTELSDCRDFSALNTAQATEEIHDSTAADDDQNDPLISFDDPVVPAPNPGAGGGLSHVYAEIADLDMTVSASRLVSQSSHISQSFAAEGRDEHRVFGESQPYEGYSPDEQVDEHKHYPQTDMLMHQIELKDRSSQGPLQCPISLSFPTAEAAEEPSQPQVTQSYMIHAGYAANIRDEQHVLGYSTERGASIVAAGTTRTLDRVGCGSESQSDVGVVAENFDQGIEDIEYEQYDDNEQVDQLEKSEHNQDQSHWSSDLPDPENYPSSSSLPSSPLPNIFTSSPASSPSWPAQYSSTPPDAELDGDDAGEKFEMLPPSLLEARQREEGSWAYEDADTHHPGGQSRVVEVYMPLLADEEDTDQLQDDAPFPAEDGSHNTPQAMLDALPPSTYPSGWSTEHLSDHSVAKKDVCKGEVPGISVTETHHKGLSMTDNYASTPAAEGLITHALPPPASKDDHDSEDERASSQQGAALASKPVFASLCGEGGRCDRIGSVGNDGATSHANPHARGCVAKEAQAVGIQEIKTSCIEANDEVHGSDIPDYPREVSQSFGSNDTGDSLNDEDVSLDTSGKVPMDEGGVSKPTRGSLAALDTASHREHQSDAELKYKIPEAPEEVHLVSAPGGPKPRRAVRPKVQLIPNPRRPTAAGQKLQEKKLAKPFKCPTITAPAPKPSSIASSSRDAGLRAEPTGFDLPQPRLDTLSKDAKALKEDTKIKHRTVRASAQFKLPLAIAPEQTLVRPTPTVQALERKVQILKRALKVTKENEEEVLEGLIHKWTEAGREIAYEVWTLVKDTTQNDDNDRRNGGISGKRKVEDGWGWDEGPDSKKAKESWGWDASSSDSEPVEGYGNEYETSADSGDTEEDMEEVKHDTIGTMLAQLGICPDTLGWNEEEGCFV